DVVNVMTQTCSTDYLSCRFILLCSFTDPVATFYSNLNRVDIPPDYESRATMEVNVAEKISTLHLTKVTIQDSRNYECNVLIPGDDEGTTSATTNLLVLVPPSKPICRIEGTVEYFHDITLTCMSEEGSPKPVYEWKSYSVENVPRPFPPKTTETLSLFNISREMSGFYICTSTNRVGSAACNMTLAVLPEIIYELMLALKHSQMCSV
uniref:Glycoprotein A33 (transmembrane), paralog b n=1 Tax=Sphaeramia orbicularis TaxID=375764 RepID=A0A672ZFG0_9TELE